MLKPDTYHLPRHARAVSADSASLAKCVDSAPSWFPRHHANYYAHFAAKHKAVAA